jgi:uncharacterized membrane protein (Fun14 family)
MVDGIKRRETPARIAAALWALWGILHVWVGAEGLRRYSGGAKLMWDLVVGGPAAPRASFQHTTDAVTANVHAHLMLNFCLDVGGYGVLGLAIAWAIWKRPAWGWAAYALGVVAIGIADLSFLLLQVTSGISELNAGTVSGPTLWFLAIVVTPFGLPSRGATTGAPALG